MFEVSGVLREVEEDWGFIVAEVKTLTDRCASRNRQVVHKYGMRLMSDDFKIFEVGEGHYSSGRSVRGVWECVIKSYFAKGGSALEEVEQSSHRYVVDRNVMKAECPEVRHVLPGQVADHPV